MSAIRYARSHEWVRIDGDDAVIGISPYAQSQLGDIVYVELPEPGLALLKGREAAVVESVKAASEVYAPLSGKVVEINPKLADDPALVNKDPLGDGWFFKLRLDDPADAASLLDQAAYDSLVAGLE